MRRPALLAALAALPAHAAPQPAAAVALGCAAPARESVQPFYGVGEDPDRDAAIREARADADAQLCQGVDALRCEALYQHRLFEEPLTAKARGGWQACVVSLVDRRVYGELPGEDELRAGLARLGARLPPGTAALDAVRWAGGCPAGPAGHALANALVAKAPSGVAAERPRLVLELSVLHDGWVHALLFAGDGGARAVLGELEVDARFFDLDTSAGRACWDWRAAGLDAAARPAADGLTLAAWLSPPLGTADAAPGDYCSGDQATLTVTATAATPAWAFSLRPDGTGLFMGRVTVPAEAPFAAPLDLFAAGSATSESILLVAPAAGASPGAFAAWSRPCRLGAPFDARAIATDAAVALVGLATHPAGDDRCGYDAAREARRRADEAAFVALPACGALTGL